MASGSSQDKSKLFTTMPAHSGSGPALVVKSFDLSWEDPDAITCLLS
jgi:hypothetical protein